MGTDITDSESKQAPGFDQGHHLGLRGDLCLWEVAQETEDWVDRLRPTPDAGALLRTGPVVWRCAMAALLIGYARPMALVEEVLTTVGLAFGVFGCPLRSGGLEGASAG